MLINILQGLAYKDWGNPWFLLQFLMSCTMGFVLNYSIVLCTHCNSALTTNIVGVLKVSEREIIYSIKSYSLVREEKCTASNNTFW